MLPPLLLVCYHVNPGEAVGNLSQVPYYEFLVVNTQTSKLFDTPFRTRRINVMPFSICRRRLSESLARILAGLNRDLEGLARAPTVMRPYRFATPVAAKTLAN